MPRTVNVKVTTADALLEFSIQQNTTGKQLFDQVTNLVGLRETWYFGLSYVDIAGMQAWLSMEKKVLNQAVKKETPLQFHFKAKFYPEDVAEELIQDITRHMFYLQVKEAILNEDIYCPPESSVLLASYAVQAKYGDYNPSELEKGFLDNDKVLPQVVVTQHSVTKEQWEKRIVAWYAEHSGMHQEDAVLEYLKIAQDLEMYGVSYFEIRNKKGTELLLGVDALGINVYEKSNKLAPKISFPWSEIRNVSFSNRKFVIRPTDKKSQDFIFYTSSRVLNKRIVELCVGNHELYAERRKPDSVEVQQLKMQAKHDRDKRRAERLLLANEKKEREEAERKKQELEEQLNRYSTQYESAQQELESMQSAARQLEEKMLEAERQKQELEEAQWHAEESRRAAEETANHEKAERQLREQEMHEAQLRLEQKLEEARLKEEQSLRLQMKLAEAHQKIEENERRGVEEEAGGTEGPAGDAEAAAATAPLITVNGADEQQGALNDVMYENVERRSSSSSSHSAHSRHSYHGDAERPDNDDATFETSMNVDDDRCEQPPEPQTPGEQSHELQLLEHGGDVDGEEEDRVTHAEKNEWINQQLKTLSAELEAAKLQTAVTHNDTLYRKIVATGRDKYKTLKQIRAGNTKQRVDMFEAM